MSSDIPKQLRRLTRKSESGDFISTYQLAKMYSEGITGIDVNLAIAQEYKTKCAEQLADYQFSLNSLKLINFKGFEHLDISFSQKGNTTVLVGNNGSGKSTVLDAIQKTLTHLSSRLTTRSYNGEQIDEIEIANGDDFSTIIPTFTINSVRFSLELSQSRPLIEVKKKSKFSEINELGSILRLANSSTPNFSFPLLASYTVERANDVTTKDIEESEEILNNHTWDKSKAYSKSLTGKADFKLFFRWFKEQIEQENEDSSEMLALRAQIKSKQKELDSPLLKALMSDKNASESAQALVNSYAKDLEILKTKLNAQSDINSKSLDIVRSAIYKFLPDFSDLKLRRNPLDMTIKKGEEVLSVLQLSQGEKSLLALVADIARRLTLLNPGVDNPLDGTGLVLIDEIDLHLHPQWQQNIVSRLEATFKNLQFIVTTHSPQVCHTVDSDNIWLLKNGTKFKAPKGMRGAVSSWVLESLFEVDKRPPEDSITILLQNYKKIVYDNKYDSEQALKFRKELIDHFGADYDELVELDLYIENREWEKGFEEDL
ncbi:retron Ec78 anti-phage system effector ATPase PtuA [Vibrio alginolyticus]|uniref:retron Ec78 anti-phage system effector ATPase PtuA n=1 Tax=Vibrio alginolyticus TaxID=663 RepID=UPI00355014E0